MTSVRSLLAVASVAAVGVPATAAAASRDQVRFTAAMGDSDVATRAEGAPAVLYLNRGGGSYRPGADDPVADTTSLVERAVTIPAWNVDRRSWNRVLDCSRDLLDRWHVEVTDVDPGDVPHYEVVIGGRPADAGLAAHFAGIAPFSSACRALPSAVAFAFVELIDSDLDTVCQVVVHEFAHTLGLDHEVECRDPMSYLHGCGDKAFQDVEAPCGEGTARECLCGGDTQNSVALLDARLGERGVGNPAPTVTISEPAAGAVVAPGFAIEASAFDNAGVAEVELWIDGDLVARSDSAPFRFTTGKNLGDGRHQVEIRAIDAGGAVSRELREVIVARPTSVPAPPPVVSDEPAGGCAASGGSGGAMILALAAMVAGLRRRAR